MSQTIETAFRGKTALITGGMGFIGSNLAIRLANLGAKVTVVDSMIPDYGGNEFNLAPVKDRVRINYCDIRDDSAINYLVRGQDYVFHLAGQVCHLMSLSNPFPDIEINITGTAVLMEALRQYNPTAICVYTGTRGQYGASVSLPVNEEAPTNPKGIYEISNLTAEKIIKVYNDAHGIRSVLLRLSNIYGPRSQMKHSRFGVCNWFVRLAMDNEAIQVYGDGSILRDFCYVDDTVEAIIRSAIVEKAYGEIFNVGSDIPVSFLELVKTIIDVAKQGKWNYAEFSQERKAQEPGDFYSDISKIEKIVGWRPTTTLEDGLAKTIDYYSKNREYYWSKQLQLK
ncbi:MAG: GDP-mannose 4,6-dehydratase [Candidatus Obscuribacter sp.]|jgi:UDP-glucose 4-epimerase|nr:GDP-mannose 4,6-dehydratase [Candidatus Obscuribacter sp.]MDQ5967213.1 UDP-glucose 4-epimerase [Cyanobacteriota bacterium erpe_2018_sw_39hr_WHONDRS-SW48-000098_B_bin.30]MBK9201678.1 GDP-mannose 4,6-dehydratase [Candidatus Obscuribacter sp.]MBK9619976.1 GDP-mannose 4,6-dehydratase [Candidatus Obscuribacter sp.]MBK9770558.1 GDP-mannose 4,6-dehydratase [Candidatus Obscuribacter sp.]